MVEEAKKSAPSDSKPKIPSLPIGDPSGSKATKPESGRVSGRPGESGRASGRPGERKTSGRSKPVLSVFCHEAMIKGNVTFGDGCIVHPGANINAEEGDIVFGDFNIVEEYARIVNKPREDGKGNVVRKTMRIGSYNTFEVSCYIESSDIGDMNDFGVKSSVLKGC